MRTDSEISVLRVKENGLIGGSYDQVPLPDPPDISSDHHRRRQYSEDVEWSSSTRCFFGWLTLLAEILLFGALVLVLYWTMKYRGGFAWTENITKQFNLHPLLMVAGFIFFMGHAMLVYRQYRCCRHIFNKLIHTIMHLMAIPCIAVGAIAVFDSHDLRETPIPNLYSLHSWLGLVTMGMFALQFVVGFFSFLILLCCDTATASCRGALVPIHQVFGVTTFMLAIATCVTGLTEKAFFTLSTDYANLPEEGIVMNALAMVLAGLGILMPCLILHGRYRRAPKNGLTERL